MTQNTEQNVRTRDEQAQWMGQCIRASGAQPSLEGFLREHIRIAEARGAEEQRRKDAEGQEPIYQVQFDGRCEVWTDVDLSGYVESEYDNYNVRTLYTCPANAAALEAEIASLKEAEQLARADAEASKAREAKLKKVALDVLQVCQRSKMGPSDLGYVTNMIRAALTREGGV